MTDSEFKAILEQFLLDSREWLDGTPPPPPELPVINAFTVEPSDIDQGQDAILSWEVTGADEVSIAPEVGVVDSDGDEVVAPAHSTTYVLTATNTAGSVTASVSVHVAVPPLPPGVLTHGVVPEDGWLGHGTPQIVPQVEHGQRLSGTVTIEPRWTGLTEDERPPVRLVVDGEPQPSMTIDTTQFANGTHALAIQVVEQLDPAKPVGNGTRTVVINNSGVAFTNLSQQVVHEGRWQQGRTPWPSSLAWARVDCSWPQTAYPIDPQLDKHPAAQTNEDRRRLAEEEVWWIEGLSHQGTKLFEVLPILAKNREGDVFVKDYNPQSTGRSGHIVGAARYTQTAPKFDGPRGVGWVSPYSTITPDPYYIFRYGETGWIGVDLSGRVMRIGIDGSVETIVGPRSVAGVIQTDPDLDDITIEDRVAMGEMEYVGSHEWPHSQAPASGWLDHPTDIWQCNLFPFEGVIACNGNQDDPNDGYVREVCFGNGQGPLFDKPGLMRKWPLPKVTSVWASNELQSRPYNTGWFAVNPQGLWKLPVDPDGKGGPGGHPSQPVLVAEIPGAWWVRGDRKRVYVVTIDLQIWEYNPDTNEAVLRKPHGTKGGSFAFATVDENGSVGPRGRLYYSCSKAKTHIWGIDTDTWEVDPVSGEGVCELHKLIINKKEFGSWQVSRDTNGHYLWGVALHATLPKILAAGSVSSSWMYFTGCLGARPVTDPRYSMLAGMEEYKQGVCDQYVGLSTVFGDYGHGAIGFSCDEFMDLKTWEEARPIVRARLDPMFHPSQSEELRETIARQVFRQRTRKHFQ